MAEKPPWPDSDRGETHNTNRAMCILHLAYWLETDGTIVALADRIRVARVHKHVALVFAVLCAVFAYLAVMVP